MRGAQQLLSPRERFTVEEFGLLELVLHGQGGSQPAEAGGQGEMIVAEKFPLQRQRLAQDQFSLSRFAGCVHHRAEAQKSICNFSVLIAESVPLDRQSLAESGFSLPSLADGREQNRQTIE